MRICIPFLSERGCVLAFHLPLGERDRENGCNGCFANVWKETWTPMIPSLSYRKRDTKTRCNCFFIDIAEEKQKQTISSPLYRKRAFTTIWKVRHRIKRFLHHCMEERRTTRLLSDRKRDRERRCNGSFPNIWEEKLKQTLIKQLFRKFLEALLNES